MQPCWFLTGVQRLRNWLYFDIIPSLSSWSHFKKIICTWPTDWQSEKQTIDRCEMPSRLSFESHPPIWAKLRRHLRGYQVRRCVRLPRSRWSVILVFRQSSIVWSGDGRFSLGTWHLVLERNRIVRRVCLELVVSSWCDTAASLWCRRRPAGSCNDTLRLTDSYTRNNNNPRDGLCGAPTYFRKIFTAQLLDFRHQIDFD